MATDVQSDHAVTTTDGELPLVGIDRRRAGLGAVGFLGFLGLWWVAALLQPPYVLPAPPVVAEAAFAELASGEITTALGEKCSSLGSWDDHRHHPRCRRRGRIWVEHRPR
jgi:hypothetical protein